MINFRMTLAIIFVVISLVFLGNAITGNFVFLEQECNIDGDCGKIIDNSVSYNNIEIFYFYIGSLVLLVVSFIIIHHRNL